MPKTIRRFIQEFEHEFSAYLRPAGEQQTKAGRQPPEYSKCFVVFVGEKRFSDWDLHCTVDADTVGLPVLHLMRRFIKDFSGFTHTKDFIGNKMPQFMAFIPAETHAPFVDVHIEGVSDEIKREYFSGLDRETAEREMTEWLIITWMRKRRNDDETSRYILDWLGTILSPHDYAEACEAPEKFLVRILEGRGYDEIVERLGRDD